MIEHTESRLIRMGERLAKVETRTEILEETLPRIGALEAGVAALSTRIEGVSQDIHGIQRDGHRTVEALQALQGQHAGLSEKISRLFWTGAGAMLVIGALLSGISFLASVSNIDGWLERREAQTRPTAARPTAARPTGEARP